MTHVRSLADAQLARSGLVHLHILPAEIFRPAELMEADGLDLAGGHQPAAQEMWKDRFMSD